MSKLYAPKTENIVPAFAGKIIFIPYSPSAYNSASEWNKIKLIIKDPLLQDTTIITTYSTSVSGSQAQFELTDQEINKLICGNKYKGYLACCKINGDVVEVEGQYSNAFVIKYLGITAPSITDGELDSAFVFSGVYVPPSDATEKLYSVKYILKDKNEQIVEQSEEILLNYSNIFIDNTTNKVNLTYQFKPHFDVYSPKNYDINNLYQKYDEINAWANEPIEIIYTDESNTDLDYYPCVNALQDFYATSRFDFKVEDIDNLGIQPDYLGLPPKEKYSVYVQFTTLNQYNNTEGPWALEPVWYMDTEQNYTIFARPIVDLAINNVVFEENNSVGQNVYCLRINTFSDSVRRMTTTESNLIALTQKVYTKNITTSNNNYGYGMIDFDLEQGMGYNYVLCYTNSVDEKNYYVITGNVSNNFESMFLCDSEHILCLKFNPKVTNYKTTRQETKTETIGSPYPMLFRNAHIGYQEFTINTLISYFMDQECFFINGMRDSKYNHLRSSMIEGFSPMFMSVSRASDGSFAKKYDFTPSTQLDEKNIYIEREFKKAVLDWFSNGEVKLFKSPVENNHLIRLINITTTPEEKLGRMLHSCSAQAIEVEAYSDDNISHRDMLYYKNL